jgi:hypothetical protein
MMQPGFANLNLHNDTIPSRPTGNVKAAGQRIDLTLKKISEQSEDTLQCVPLSSACTSGCFSSVSSISVKSGDFSGLDDAEIEKVIRLHGKALDVMGEDAMVSASIAKGIELGLNTR